MSSDPLLNQTIGHYEIVDRLGRGGMATVYRARQATMQRDVAVKVMSVELADDPQFVARFEQEAQMIANLEHPRIVPVHDFGHEGDLFYLVMRLVEGETLHQRLLDGPQTLDKAAHFTDQIAEALDYAHRQGIVHRDLKPNNILLDEWDNVYLMDFGLAKMLSSSQRLTASGAVLGTPTYMAPELWRGDTVDARTDAYSLGVILFEMVVGRPPFESDQPFTLMYKHLNDEPPTPHEWLPDLSDTIEGVMLKALAKAPADRFQSAGELARAYRAAVQGQAVDVSPRQALPGVDVRPEAPTQFESELPLPVDISPPPVTSAPTVAPLGDYGAPEGMPVSAGAPDDSGSDSPLPFELPDKMPPAVRDVIEWAAEKGKTVTIPGFVEPSPEVSARKQPGRLPAQVDAGPWRMPDETQAFRQVVGLLNNNEPLIGALYVRGTANWGLWRRLLVAGLIMSIIVGIFGELFSLWLLHVLSTVFWLYVLWQGFRTWRGKIGHYYAGFTPDRVVILPLTPDGIPQPGDAEMAPWTRMQRLRLTDEYLWLEASGAATVTFLGWVPRHGPGGLDNQRKWLLASPIARLVREKGFYVKQ